ncbi:MAG: hypothetical protein JST04_15635 [Bdellovibrionales bacterium]|nr:hypothetical protein [Bdellovibrionales bacterium]
MNLLIIGAGAVGSAYGYLASRAGAKVAYLIKPKHRADLKDGIQLYWWKGRRAESISFQDFEMIDDSKALRARKFDAVLITLPSDKFRAEGWLAGFLGDFDAGSPEAKIWSLQPSTNDQKFLRDALGGSAADARVVRGQIPILSYLAPLPGEEFAKPGYAFYTPPTSKAAWSSKNAAAAEAAKTLFDTGGLPSKIVDDRPTAGALIPEALLRAVVAGLERSEWSFDRLVNGENIFLVTGGMREMTAIGAKIGKTADPARAWWGKLASSPFGVKTAMRLVRKIIPFDFEAFLRVHFTKVDAQMHLTLDEQIEYGKKNGLSTTNLVLLRGRKKVAAH